MPVTDHSPIVTGALYIADMTDYPRIRVRPTIRFLRDLGQSFPRLEEPLWRIPHPLVALMQKTPDSARATGKPSPEASTPLRGSSGPLTRCHGNRVRRNIGGVDG